MSLRAPLAYAIPKETVRVAQAAFPNGNRYMRMRDSLGPIYTNPEFAQLFPHSGQPAEAPAQLALITIMQFAEGLSDSQAADAVRARIDWKYALALELTDPGFDASVLSDFRSRLLQGHAEALLFERMLTLFREQGYLKLRGRQRTDSTHVLAAIHVLNRLECIGETLRQALNALATVAPDWLRSWAPAVWFDRYARRVQDYRLPESKAERYALASEIGTDGRHLLSSIYAEDAPPSLPDLPAVQILRQVWIQQFYAPDAVGQVQWRTAEDLPPASQLISTPYDVDARYSKKRETEWTGYKVHLTEAYDDDTPNLITDVTTTAATTTDYESLPQIQAKLAARAMLPAEHIVDSGYITAEHLVTSQTEHAIELVGPVNSEQSWQARAENGFAIAQFAIDWEAQQAICPQGQTSISWLERRDQRDAGMIHITFAKASCAACPVRSHCTQSARLPRRLQIHNQAQHTALLAARERQHTQAFKSSYAERAGIEGTLSQGVRMGDLRRSRYRGEAKTRLMHLVLAAALNFVRVAAWLADRPRSQTRVSAFGRLAPAAG
jgi:transposase